MIPEEGERVYITERDEQSFITKTIGGTIVSVNEEKLQWWVQWDDGHVTLEG